MTVFAPVICVLFVLIDLTTFTILLFNNHSVVKAKKTKVKRKENLYKYDILEALHDTLKKFDAFKKVNPTDMESIRTETSEFNSISSDGSFENLDSDYLTGSENAGLK